MQLIQGLLAFFAVSAIGAFIYQLIRKRPLLTAVHYAVVFGLAVMLIVYVAAIALDILDITPEPEEYRAASTPLSAQ